MTFMLSAKSAARVAALAVTLVGVSAAGTAGASAATVRPATAPTAYQCTKATPTEPEICLGVYSSGDYISSVQAQTLMPVHVTDMSYYISSSFGWVSGSKSIYANPGANTWVTAYNPAVGRTESGTVSFCAQSQLGQAVINSVCVSLTL